MNDHKSEKNMFSYYLLVSGILLLVWWILLGISQISGAGEGSLVSMVQAPYWIPINTIGLAASVFLVFGLFGLLLRHHSQWGAFGNTGLIIGTAGTVLFTAVQFDETFVWPLLSRHAGNLLELDGPMFTDPAFFTMYIIMGMLFIIGFVFLSIQILKHRLYPRTAAVFLLAGAVLFGGGILVPVIMRTLGVVLVSAALVWTGIYQIKRA